MMELRHTSVEARVTFLTVNFHDVGLVEEVLLSGLPDHPTLQLVTIGFGDISAQKSTQMIGYMEVWANFVPIL